MKKIIISIIIILMFLMATPMNCEISYNSIDNEGEVIYSGETIASDEETEVGSETVNEYESLIQTIENLDQQELKENIIDPRKEKIFEQSEPFKLVSRLDFGQPLYVPRQIIIKFKEHINFDIDPYGFPSANIKSVDTLLKENNVQNVEKLFSEESSSLFSDIYKFSIRDDIDVISLKDKFASDSHVEYVEPNYIGKIFLSETKPQITVNQNFQIPRVIPNDQKFGEQWALHNIGQTGGTINADIDAPEAWTIEKGILEIVIAVLDTGVDYTHPDLADNIWINQEEDRNRNGKFDNWPFWKQINGVYGDLNFIDDDGNDFIDDIIGWNFADFTQNQKENDPLDDFGHGTLCAGIISAVTNNEQGIAGVCWNCKIMAIKVADSSGTMTEESLSNAIKYATDNGAKVISMSLGIIDNNLLKNAIEYAIDNNVFVVSSAGNDDLDFINYPAGYDTVMAVAATDHNDDKAFFSNYGGWIDVAAPGLDILSTMPTYDVILTKDGYGYNLQKYYDYFSGTSASCPIVAGVAGLLLSKNPELEPDIIRTIISNTADKISTLEYIGSGRINSHTALMNTHFSVSALLNEISSWNNITGVIDILGSAVGEDFEYYRLEYARGRSQNSMNWIEFCNSEAPLFNDILGALNTQNMDDGFYTIRLSVSASGKEFYAIKFIIINNQQNVFYVDDDGSEIYNSIQDAVYDAGNGDIVNVNSGLYQEERIHIINSIKLLGENKDTTIIDGSGYQYSTILVFPASLNASQIQFNLMSVEISNFTIQNQKFGAIVMGFLFDSRISNNIIKDNNYFGLNLITCNTTTIDHNIIKNIGILGNIEIYSIFGGIGLNIVDNSIIENNFIYNCEWAGIQLYDSFFDIISDNNIQHIKEPYGDGLIIDGTSYTDILLNKMEYCSNCGIIQTDFSINNNFSKNIIAHNTNNGLLSYIITAQFNITDNFIQYNGKYGIYIDLVAFSNTFFNNNISGNGLSGLNLAGAFNNQLIKNNISNNNKNGIDFSKSSYNELGNWYYEFSQSYFLTLLINNFPSFKNTVFCNNITKNKNGIFIQDFSCLSNEFYYNNFIQNIQFNAYDLGTNTWYEKITLKGNYWDDYNGVDLDGDGIGDIPSSYDINPYILRNKDKRPLMYPYGTETTMININSQNNQQPNQQQSNPSI